MQKMLNTLEDTLNLSSRTIIKRISENSDEYLIVAPIEWCRSTVANSLYTLLLRVLMVADKEQDIVEFLKNYVYNGGDKQLLRMSINKIELIIKEKKLPLNRRVYSKEQLIKGRQSPHGAGICGWDCQFEEVSLIK